MTIADIQTLARFLTKTTTTTLSAANLLILQNKYYEEIIGKILTETSGGSDPFGDLNYTAFPTFTVSMTNGTASYDLNDWIVTTSQQTIARSTPLVILGVEVADQNGDWHPLKKISFKDIKASGIAQPEYTPTSGQPREYEFRDNLITLYPAPDNGVTVTLTNGLRLYFLRSADIFTSAEVTTGTKEPGFPRPWHDLLAYGPAYDYGITNGFPNSALFRAEYDRRMNEMLSFIGKRDQDVTPRLTTRSIGHR